MTEPTKTIEERIAALEHADIALAKSMETLKRRDRENRAQIRKLTKLVEALPGALDVQTAQLKTEIAESQAQLAGKWPTTAIVIATGAVALIVGAALHLLGWA